MNKVNELIANEINNELELWLQIVEDSYSVSSEYKRGYTAGIIRAKKIVNDLFGEEE